MSKNKLLLFSVAAVIFLIPVNSFAWGPGVHIYVGMSILDNLSMIQGIVGDIILKYPYYFLYGCISPDVLIGKGKKIEKVPSHDWNTGFKLLSIDDERVKSYAIGYLSHLASDVVSHNYLVPNMLQLFKINRGKFFHVLVEGCIDRKLDIKKDIINDLMNTNFKEIDELLVNTINNKKYLFKFKKILFKKGILFNFINRKKASKKINYNLIENKILDLWPYVQDMIKLSERSVVDVINRQNRSHVTQYDPMGFKHLNLAKQSNRLSFKNRYRGVVPFFMPSMHLLNL